MGDPECQQPEHHGLEDNRWAGSWRDLFIPSRSSDHPGSWSVRLRHLHTIGSSHCAAVRQRHAGCQLGNGHLAGAHPQRRFAGDGLSHHGVRHHHGRQQLHQHCIGVRIDAELFGDGLDLGTQLHDQGLGDQCSRHRWIQRSGGYTHGDLYCTIESLSYRIVPGELRHHPELCSSVIKRRFDRPRVPGELFDRWRFDLEHCDAQHRDDHRYVPDRRPRPGCGLRLRIDHRHQRRSRRDGLGEPDPCGNAVSAAEPHRHPRPHNGAALLGGTYPTAGSDPAWLRRLPSLRIGSHNTDQLRHRHGEHRHHQHLVHSDGSDPWGQLQVRCRRRYQCWPAVGYRLCRRHDARSPLHGHSCPDRSCEQWPDHAVVDRPGVG